MMKQEENGHTKLIEQARTLLSPYLDDEVTSAERELVETVLAQSPELQTELEGLQATVNLVRELPRISAPRPFTLTEADVGLTSGERKAFSWSTWLKPMMGGLVVVIAVLIAVAYLFRPGLLPTSRQEALSVARAPDQSVGAVAEEAAEAPAVAPAQEERAGEEEAAVVETVVEPGEVEKVAEVEKEVEVAEEPPAELAAEEAVTLDQGTEVKPASEAPAEPEVSQAEAVPPPQPLPTSSPVLEMLAQPEPVEEPAAAAEVAEEGIAAQKAAPEVAQEAVVTPTATALARAIATPFATATPSPMTTPSPPTATPTKSVAEPSLEQAADDGATATSVAADTSSPTVLAQTTRIVEQAQTPMAQESADFTSTARSLEAQSRGDGETSLITLLPTGLMIMLVVGGILVVVLLWRFFRQR